MGNIIKIDTTLNTLYTMMATPNGANPRNFQLKRPETLLF